MPDAATHAMAEAVAEFAVPAIVRSISAIRQISVIAVVIGLISVARHGTAIGRIVYGPDRTFVLVEKGLRGSRLRSGKCSHGQPNAASQHSTLVESLLR